MNMELTPDEVRLILDRRGKINPYREYPYSLEELDYMERNDIVDYAMDNPDLP